MLEKIIILPCARINMQSIFIRNCVVLYSFSQSENEILELLVFPIFSFCFAKKRIWKNEEIGTISAAPLEDFTCHFAVSPKRWQTCALTTRFGDKVKLLGKCHRLDLSLCDKITKTAINKLRKHGVIVIM
jgi:hypothetical protein